MKLCRSYEEAISSKKRLTNTPNDRATKTPVFYGVPLRTKIRKIIFHSKSNVFAVEVEYFEFEVEYIKIEVENRNLKSIYKIEVET